MFQHLGYFKEYFIGYTSIGYIDDVEKDREEMGYKGRMKEVASEDLVMFNKKKIKKGTEVTTVLYPKCGRVIKN